MSPYRILAVDDSSTVRAVIAKTLRLAGVEVATFDEAATGHEALALLRRERYDLVFCDLNMPGMSGDELVAVLEREGRLAAVAVVIITSLGDSERLRALMLKGMKGYLRKPVRPEELRALVDRVMGATNEPPA